MLFYQWKYGRETKSAEKKNTTSWFDVFMHLRVQYAGHSYYSLLYPAQACLIGFNQAMEHEIPLFSIRPVDAGNEAWFASGVVLILFYFIVFLFLLIIFLFVCIYLIPITLLLLHLIFPNGINTSLFLSLIALKTLHSRISRITQSIIIWTDES